MPTHGSPRVGDPLLHDDPPGGRASGELRGSGALVREASARLGVDAGAYPGAVRRRLALGARRYGEGAFLERDNTRELLEETPDGAAYCLLAS